MGNKSHAIALLHEHYYCMVNVGAEGLVIAYLDSKVGAVVKIL